MIKGVGIDIIEIERIEKALKKTPRFRFRLFTERERAECESKSDPVSSFAARFAAKEAVFKALGVGCSLGWSSVEVVSDKWGCPQVYLQGKAVETSVKLGVQGIKVSLTHSRQYAAAVAIAIGALGLELEEKA